MFSRFMIVFWCLFSLLGAGAVVGHLLQAGYSSDLLDLEEQIELVTAQKDKLRWDEKMSAEVNADSISRKMQLVAEIRGLEQRWNDVAVKRGSWRNPTFILSYSAAMMLLWNIIWHTGHWIWMGRKAK